MFKRQFRERFGRDVAYKGDYAYEAAIVLFDALSRAETPEKLKYALRNRTYQGLSGKIKINEYGDTTRKYFFSTVKNGRFISPD